MSTGKEGVRASFTIAVNTSRERFATFRFHTHRRECGRNGLTLGERGQTPGFPLERLRFLVEPRAYEPQRWCGVVLFRRSSQIAPVV